MGRCEVALRCCGWSHGAQGDVLCAEWIAHTPEGAHSGQVLGSFVHMVDAVDCTLRYACVCKVARAYNLHSTINTGGETQAELRRAWERDFNIYTAETYVGLATQAFQQVRLATCTPTHTQTNNRVCCQRRACIEWPTRRATTCAASLPGTGGSSPGVTGPRWCSS